MRRLRKNEREASDGDLPAPPHADTGPRCGHHHLLHRGRDVGEDRQGLESDRQHDSLYEGVSAIAFASKVTLEKV